MSYLAKYHVILGHSLGAVLLWALLHWLPFSLLSICLHSALTTTVRPGLLTHSNLKTLFHSFVLHCISSIISALFIFSCFKFIFLLVWILNKGPFFSLKNFKYQTRCLFTHCHAQQLNSEGDRNTSIWPAESCACNNDQSLPWTCPQVFLRR